MDGMDIAEVARHATSLDGVRRQVRQGLPGWYVGNRLVARQEDAETLLIRADFDDRERLLEADPATFSVPPRIEGHQKVFADLRHGDAAAIRRAITGAWELQRG